jgi:exodeoxyribonuclease V gamma subunit
MSFHLYVSDDLDTLAAELARLIRAPADPARMPDPFFRETVTVPNQGIARWLSLRIAAINGLCPAMDFPYPGAFIYRHVFNPMTGTATANAPADSEDDLPFNPATVRWRILKLLPGLESAPSFARVKSFVAGDPLRRYQLAGRLAQLFDRYMTYRPDMLAAWESGAQPVEGADAQWQCVLWQELIRMDAGTVRHFSGLYQRFIRETTAATPQRFLDNIRKQRRVFYFGVSSLPPAHLDILFRLSAIDDLDIHFFALNPCREEWSGARSLKSQLRDKATLVQAIGARQAEKYATPSNLLLGSLGRSGQEFFTLLLAYDTIAEHTFFSEPDATPANALAVIQRGILTNTKPTKDTNFDHSDRSITIHACHSPMRETEVLRDQLLHLFRTLPDLAPREISVYTPKLDLYAPYIDAVFGNSVAGEPGHIPYTIADKSLLQEHAECQAFLALLTVATSRFKASEVLGLLENETVRARFGFDAENLPRLGSLLKQANLAWGLDSAFRASHSASAINNNTWEFALNRLILGAAMWDTSDSAAPLPTDTGAILPCDAAEGQALTVGRLAEFIAALRELHTMCSTQRTCSEWRARLEDALNRFFAPDEQSPYGVIMIRETLERFAQFTTNAGCQDLPLPFNVVFAWLKEQLAGTAGSERFMSGHVTFSRFQPMRNAPARVVCMLGMNDGDFPSTADSLSFDLMDRRTRRALGDRQSRDEERYAFLETLMATRERLIITYTGQSSKDNKPLPPSVLVSELLDTVDASFNFTADTPDNAAHIHHAAELLTVRHPLHPFSPAYFKPDKGDDRLVSFSRSHYQVAAALEAGPQPSEICTDKPSADLLAAPQPDSADQPVIIKLDDLIYFFKSPCKYFYTQCIGAYLDVRAEELPSDEEALDPGSLMSYDLATRLLDALDNVPDTDIEARAETLRLRWEAAGMLVPGTREYFYNTLAVARLLLKAKRDLSLGATDKPALLDVALSPELRLQGSLTTFSNQKQMLVMRPAEEKPKDIVTARLLHLAACAAGLQPTTHTIFTDKKNAQCKAYEPFEQQTAIETLIQLAHYYHAGLQHPLCFDPDIGHKIAQGEERRITTTDWIGDGHYNNGTDIYTRHAFGDTLPDPDSAAWQTMRQVGHVLFKGLPDEKGEQ